MMRSTLALTVRSSFISSRAYSGYRKARDEMKELLTVKANVDRIMGYEEEKRTEKDHTQEQSQGR